MATYAELISAFPLLPITNQEQLLNAQSVLTNLIEKKEVNSDERNYYNVLSVLVLDYQDNEDWHDIGGTTIELLRELRCDRTLNPAKLAKDFGSVERAEDFVAGKVNLTLAEIETLSRKVGISVTVLCAAKQVVEVS